MNEITNTHTLSFPQEMYTSVSIWKICCSKRRVKSCAQTHTYTYIQFVHLKPQLIGLTQWDVSDWLWLEEQAAWECGNGDLVAQAAVKLSDSQPQAMFQFLCCSKDWAKLAKQDKSVKTLHAGQQISLRNLSIYLKPFKWFLMDLKDYKCFFI